MSDRGTSGIAQGLREHWRTIMVVVVAALGAAVLAALIVTVGHANRERGRALTLQSQSFDVMLRARVAALANELRTEAQALSQLMNIRG